MTTVKNKVRAGTVFLFFLLLLSGGPGIYYVIKLKEDARVILKNNYESLDYGHRMLALLDSLPANREAALNGLQKQLQLQEANITEPGEMESTAALKNGIAQLQKDSSSSRENSIRSDLYRILSMNMSAIEAKNRKAAQTADKAVMYLGFIAGLIFIIAITFAYNFPSIVTNPIRELTEAIKQIGARNYKHRIHLERKDEFGQMADAYNAMAERLEYFENSNLNRILFEKNRAEAVINSLKDAGIGIDKNGTVLFANDQALQLLGLAADDIVGKPVAEVSQRNDLFRFLVSDTSNSPFKIVVDNRENYFIRETVDVQQAEGTGSKVMLLKNITPFKELDVAKTNFIATISHELKTPLASSDFGLTLLEDERVGQLSGEQKELVKHLKEDNQRMLRILGELLNLSQVETGRLELRLGESPVPQLVKKAVETVQSAANQKGISLREELQPSLPPVLTDPEKTVWVLTNLLTNAIKFSPTGATITIQAQQQGALVRFIISDQGPGIDPQYLPRIFERYFKVPGNTHLGNGLGLSISKEFIEAMNGRIWADSEPGAGSRFSFELKAILP